MMKNVNFDFYKYFLTIIDIYKRLDFFFNSDLKKIIINVVNHNQLYNILLYFWTAPIMKKGFDLLIIYFINTMLKIILNSLWNN